MLHSKELKEQFKKKSINSTDQTRKASDELWLGMAGCGSGAPVPFRKVSQVPQSGLHTHTHTHTDCWKSKNSNSFILWAIRLISRV